MMKILAGSPGRQYTIKGTDLPEGIKKELQGSPDFLERAMGIEPTSGAWEAHVLPMNYARLYVKNDNILNCFWQGNLLKKTQKT